MWTYSIGVCYALTTVKVFEQQIYDSKMYNIIFWERKHVFMILKVAIGNFLNNADFIIKKDKQYACTYQGKKLCKM